MDQLLDLLNRSTDVFFRDLGEQPAIELAVVMFAHLAQGARIRDDEELFNFVSYRQIVEALDDTRNEIVFVAPGSIRICRAAPVPGPGSRMPMRQQFWLGNQPCLRLNTLIQEELERVPVNDRNVRTIW